MLGGPGFGAKFIGMAVGALAVAAPGRADAVAVAPLVRLSIDGAPASQARLEGLGLDALVDEILVEQGFEVVSLAALHDDFQRLRYTHDCAITGAVSAASCEQFDDYAETVLEALENLEWGLNSGAPGLEALRDGGYALVGEVLIDTSERELTASFAIRAFAQGRPGAVTIRPKVIAAKAPPGQGAESQLPVVLDDLVFRGLREFGERVE